MSTPKAATAAPEGATPPAAPTPTKPKAAKPWTVFDSNAKSEPRVHEPIAGVEYRLSNSEPTQMPKEHALVFLIDPAFRVFDSSGQQMQALPKVTMNVATGGIILRPGQVVANFSELTDEALASRVMRIPGGKDLIDDGREAIMEALASHSIDRSRAGPDDGGMVDSAIPDGDLSKILGRGSSSQILETVKR